MVLKINFFFFFNVNNYNYKFVIIFEEFLKH